MNEATYVNDKVIKILILGDCQVGKTKFLLEYIKYNNNGTRTTCNRNVDDERVDDNDRDDEDDYDEVNNNTENVKEECVECGATTIDGNSSWEQYIPTSIEVYRSEFKINDIDYSLSITDISGNRQHDLYVQMRNYFYLLEKRIDVILLCFSLVDLNSYANITKKWMPEIKKSYPDVPIVLVGTKSDLKQRLKELKKASVKSNRSFNKTSNSAVNKPDEDTKAATPSKNNQNTLANELASFTKILESQLDESSRSPRKSNLKNLTSKSISILAYEVQLAKTTQLDEEEKPNEPSVPPISTASERPHSVISRISRDDLFSDLVTSNLNDYKRNNENFKQLLIKLNSIPAYLTLNDFIKLNIVDDDIEEDIEQINNDNLFNDTTVTNDTTVMNSSNTNEPRRKYVNKRQIIRLKEEINAKFYFKISLHDLNSIKNLMDKSILTAINYHLKRDKLMFIKQTVNKCNQAANSKLVDSYPVRQTPLNANLYLDINLADPCRTIDDDILIRCGDSKSVKNVDKTVKTSDTKGRGRLCGGLSRFKCFGCTRSETGTSLNTI